MDPRPGLVLALPSMPGGASDSRKTGYKIFDRNQESGVRGLTNQSSSAIRTAFPWLRGSENNPDLALSRYSQ